MTVPGQLPSYLKDPAAIYARSFALVREATDLSGVPVGAEALALRLVHACAMPEIVPDLRLTSDVMTAGRAALAAGAPVLVDCAMLAAGIIRRRLPAGNAVVCTLDNPGVAERAVALATTRSAAALDDWLPQLDGAVVAIGNAPTALFRLLELLAGGAPKPLAILAFPVGFVGAAESKQALVDAATEVPYATLLGRRGGSAMAAAAVNALAAGLET